MAKIIGNTTATPIKPDLFRNKVDQAYNPESENAQSGKAVSEVVNNLASAIKNTLKGEVLTTSDVSPVEHSLKVNVESKNLLAYPYYHTSSELNGITWTDNGDGTITVNGTATADAYFSLRNMAEGITLKGTYFLSGCPVGGSGTSYEIYLTNLDYTIYKRDFGNGVTVNITEEEPFGIYIVVRKGTTVKNLVFKPQLEKGTTATDWTPYVDVSSVEVSRYGKNLLAYPYYYPDNYPYGNKTPNGYILNGVEWTDNGDGTVTANGTATEQSYFTLRHKTLGNLRKGKYFLSGCPKGGTNNNYVIYIMGDTLPYAIDNGDGLLFEVTNEEPINIIISIRQGATVDNIVFKPQLEVGVVGTEREEYKPVQIVTANADGTVNGLTSVSPNMTLLASDGVVINLEYNKDTTKHIGNHVKADPQALTVDEQKTARDNIKAIDRYTLDNLFVNSALPIKNYYIEQYVIPNKTTNNNNGKLEDSTEYNVYPLIVPPHKKVVVSCRFDNNVVRSNYQSVRRYAEFTIDGEFLSSAIDGWDCYTYVNDTDYDRKVLFSINSATNTTKVANDIMIEIMELDGQTDTLYQQGGVILSDAPSLSIEPVQYNARKNFAVEVEDTVDKVFSHMGGEGFAFLFVSDIHYEWWTELGRRKLSETCGSIKSVCERVPLDAILVGGDLTNTGKSYTQEEANKNINVVRSKLLVNNIPVLMTVGNHDGVNGGCPNPELLYSSMMRHNESYVVREGKNPYYYMDFDNQKIRVIALNTINFNRTLGVSNEELTWLQNTFDTVPAGFDVLIFSHIGPQTTDFTTNKENVINLLNAWHNHAEYTSVTGKISNYTSVTGKIIAYVAGHQHYDWIVPETYSGCVFPVIVTTCSLTGSITPSESDINAGAINVPNRNTNTITQDAWDVFVYNKEENKLYITRFGEGEDREIDLAI